MEYNYPTETIRAITEFLFIGTEECDLNPSDLVLVLGNDYIDGTMEAVCRLYQSGKILPDATIILSGATGSLDAGKAPECDRLFTSGVENFFMPPEIFLKENRATNAKENFLYSKELIETIGGFGAFKHILCIGKAFLLRRASMYAANFQYPADKLQYWGTVDAEGRNIGKYTWWKNKPAIERVLAEIRRIGEYALSGDLSIY